MVNFLFWNVNGNDLSDTICIAAEEHSSDLPATAPGTKVENC